MFITRYRLTRILLAAALLIAFSGAAAWQIANQVEAAASASPAFAPDSISPTQQDYDGESEDDDEDDEGDEDEDENDDEEDATDYEGIVESISDTRIVFRDGRQFIINATTRIEESIRPGDRVEIEAVLVAVEVEADDHSESPVPTAVPPVTSGSPSTDEWRGPMFKGTVVSLTPTSIKLSTGHGFVIDSNTRLEGDLLVGAEVEVQFEIRFGTLRARLIRVRSAAPPDEADSAQGQTSGEGLSATVDNRFFPLEPLTMFKYEGVERDDEGESVEMAVTARVLPTIWNLSGTEVRAVLVEEWEDDELIERTLDFYAQTDDSTVLYMGEYVDDIEDGQIVEHGGQWVSGQGRNQAGVFMPANPSVGDVFEQERAPGIAEDSSEIVQTGLSVTVPAGRYTGCIKTRDFDPLGGGEENKYYCPGVGLVREEADDEYLDLISIGSFDESELDQSVIDSIGGRNKPLPE